MLGDMQQQFRSFFLSLWFHASQFYVAIIQQDAAVRSQFYITTALLYMFRLLSSWTLHAVLATTASIGVVPSSFTLLLAFDAMFLMQLRMRSKSKISSAQ
jgi:hypothetical protein